MLRCATVETRGYRASRVNVQSRGFEAALKASPSAEWFPNGWLGLGLLEDTITPNLFFYE